MGGAFAFPADDGFVTFNDPAIQAAEIPAANGISTAESLARLYAACVSDVDGPPILSRSSIDDALRVQATGPQLSGMPDDGARWGTGLPVVLTAVAADARAGQLRPCRRGRPARASLMRTHRVGFAYLSNQMGGYGDARARELTLALRAVLGD